VALILKILPLKLKRGGKAKGGGVLACAEKHPFALTFFGPFLCLRLAASA